MFSNTIPADDEKAEPVQHGTTFGQQCIFTLRSLRLQIFRQATPWTPRSEGHKAVFHSSRRIVTLSLMHHVIPLFGALALIVLNTRTMYIGNVSATVSTTIQFAAKFTEVLMQSSLAVILLDIIRKSVLSSEPLPLGSFLAPYRLTDVSFLWSLEYWGSATSSYPRGLRRVVVSLVVPALFLLAALLGPSTAVAMIPRLIRAPVAQTLVFMDDMSSLYPTQFGTTNGTISNEAATVPSLYGLTVGERIFDWKTAVIADTQGARMLHQYTNMSDDLWFVNASTTIATQAVTFLLGNEAYIARSNSVKTTALVPFINATCAMYLNHMDKRGDLSSGFIAFSNSTKSLNSLVRYQDLFSDTNDTLKNKTSGPLAVFPSSSVNASLAWYDASDVTNDTTILMAYVEYGDSASEPGTDPISSVCVINSYWVQQDLNLTKASPIVDGELNVNPDAHSLASGPPIKPFKISPSFAKRAAQLFLDANTGTSQMVDTTWPPTNILALAVSNAVSLPCSEALCILPSRPLKTEPSFLLDRSTSPPNYISTLDSQQNATVTAILGRTHDLSNYTRVTIWPSSKWTDLYSLAQFTFHHDAIGYGYNTATIPVRLSLVALSIYVCVALAHFIYNLTTGHASSSWDSIGELLMLALNSRRPGHMQGTSAGVETLETYRRPVNVRIGPDRTAELIFDDDPEAQKASWDGHYVRAQAGVKYL